MRDLEKLTQHLQTINALKTPAEISLKDLQQFVQSIAKLGINATSQARIISGLKSFFKYCLIENIITKDPSVLLEAPRVKRALPDVLSFGEIETIISKIDLSTP